jgi:hypothetical protein
VNIDSAILGFGSAVLAIFLTPRFQHNFWKRQRRAELRLKTADEVNEIAANFYMVYTRTESYELTEPFITQILVVRGKVKVLFSNEAFKRFRSMEILIASTGSRARGLGAEGKVHDSEILERADEAVRTLYEEAIGTENWTNWKGRFVRRSY